MYGFPVLYKDSILGEANDEKRQDWKLVRQNSEPKLKPEVSLAFNYLNILQFRVRHLEKKSVFKVKGNYRRNIIRRNSTVDACV